MATFIQLRGNAYIVGTNDADLISTGDGNDTIIARGGANTIRAGNGTNFISAGTGDDNITSGSGNDVIQAGNGNNTIDAGDGANLVITDSGNDDIITGAGNDIIAAGDGNNRILAGAGANRVTAGRGNDTVVTGSGNDDIDAGDGANDINAGGGNNRIITGRGNDTITSGSGNDTIRAGSGNNVINAGDGINDVTTLGGDDVINTGNGNDTIRAGYGNNVVNAGSGNNRVTTEGGQDIITALGGNDDIDSGAGNDLVDAGGGSDLINGGTGDDIIVHRIGENLGAVDRYNGGGGRDTLRLDLSAAEWARADVQADVAGFLARNSPSSAFQFTSTKLRVDNIEQLQVFVNGVEINPVNEPVTALADGISITEDSPAVRVDLLANDSVPDRAVSVTLLDSSTLGALTVLTSLDGTAQTATLNFVPDPSLQSLRQGQTVSENLRYQVRDVNGDASTANVTITVTGTNDVPTMTGTTAGEVTEAPSPVPMGSASGVVTVSDVDAGESEARSVDRMATASGYGTYSVTSAGAWTYELNNASAAVNALAQGATLSDSFDITSSDGSATRTVSLTIVGSNDAPLAQDAGISVIEDKTVSGIVQGFDVDTGAVLRYALRDPSAAPQGLTFNSDGSFSFDASSAALQRLGDADRQEIDVSYTVTDQFNASSTANLKVTVTGSNDAPTLQAVNGIAYTDTAADDSFAASSGLLLGQDIDNGASLLYGIEGGTAGTSIVDGDRFDIAKTGSYGTLYLNVSSGAYRFVPDDGAIEALKTTATDTFQFSVSDGIAAPTTQSLVVSLAGANDTARISGTASHDVREDSTLQASGLLQVSDADSGEAALQAIAAGTAGANGYGSFEVNADGHWTYTLDNSSAQVQALDATDTVTDSITVRSLDGTAQQVITVSITGQDDNRAPVAVEDAFQGTGTPLPSQRDVQVNTTTADAQQWASVAALADGGYVVTWSSVLQDGSASGIFGQRFDASGAKLGSEFQANTFTANFQSYSSVAALADGGFVLTWSSFGQDYGIFGQRFDASGAKLGSEFQANWLTRFQQHGSSVAALSDGGFVVTWSSFVQDGIRYGIYGQRFDASGAKLGSEFQPNMFTRYSQLYPSVAPLADGGFVLTWSSLGQDGSDWGIYGQRFDASGAKLGSEFQANTFTASNQHYASVAALADGGFVVTWSSLGQDGSDYGIYGQRYDASGTQLGSEFQANTVTTSDQVYSSVAALADGGFVLTWSSFGQDGSNSGIYGQRFDVSGAKLGGEFRLNEITAGQQWNETLFAGEPLAVLADGSLVAVWSGGGPEEVFVRRFALNSVSEDATTPIGTATLLANDSDPDGDTLQITSVSATSALGAVITLVDSNGDRVFDRIDYDPTGAVALQSLENGQLISDRFEYTVSDGRGGVATGTVDLRVVGVNDAASISGTATGLVAEDGTTTASGLLVVSDLDSGENRLQAIAAGTAGTNGYGSFEVTAAGEWRYTLDQASPAVQGLAEGQVVTDSVDVQSADGTARQSLTITIVGRNEVPAISGDAVGTVNDIVSGVSAGDVANAGSGDDNVFLGIALDFLEIDGGAELDLLALTGSGQTLDLNKVNPDQDISGIESLGINGSGNNTLVLDAASVLDMGGSGNIDFTVASSLNMLVVEGGADDRLSLSAAGGGHLAPWEMTGTGGGLDGSAGGAYNIWELVMGSPYAGVAVKPDMTVVGV